jgi:cleavage and polyadenylation specificity factor subunit 2
MLRITPLYGSRWEKSGVAKPGCCTLVEYADVRVLVNVGLRVDTVNDDVTVGLGLADDSSSKTSALSTSSSSFWENLPPHDCLMLTDSTLECMGSLPLYVKGVSAQKKRDMQLVSLDEATLATLPPIYATFPTVKMGQMSLYDYHANLCLDGTSPPFSLEDLDVALAQLQTIKYSQTLLLPVSSTDGSHSILSSSLKLQSPSSAPRLAVTAHRAGHVVGGAFLLLERLQDETTVVFTSTYHIAKEVHLEASTLLKYGATPDVLVTRPGGPACPMVGQLYQQNLIPRTPLVTQAERNLTNHVLNILRRDGNVLLPIDASGRALELLLVFQRCWERQRLAGSYNLVWMGNMAFNTLDFARSQLEWMNTALGDQFDNSQRTGAGGGHPYALRDVQICTNITEFEKITANGDPTCVLASGLTLDHGPARDLLLRWGDNDNNAIVFTDSSQCCHRRLRHDVILPGPFVPGADDQTRRRRSKGSRSTPMLSSSSEVVQGSVASEEIATAAAQEAGLIDTGAEGDEGDEDVGMVISVEEASKYTTSFQLLQYWCKAKLEDREMEDSVEVDVLVPKRRPLAGAELQQFLEEEEAARRAQRRKEEEEAMLREVELAKGRLRLGEDVGAGPATGGSTARGIDSAAGSSSLANLPYVRPKKKSRFDSSLFLKFSKPLHLTFEVREDAVGVGEKDVTSKFGIGESIANSDAVEDDYGFAIVPDHFVDIVTGVDSSKFAAGSGRIGDEVKRRGLGYGTSGGDDKVKKRGLAEDDEENEEEEDMDERGMEAADLSEGKGIIRGRNGRPPVRVTTVNRRFQVFAEIDYMPLEGRVDAQAARQSVRALQPRQVVVLGGVNDIKMDTDEKDDSLLKGELLLEMDEVKELADAARGFITTNKDVLTPSDGETVELRVGHAAYTARLIATPYRTKDEEGHEEIPVEPIELHETQIGACTVSLLDYVATGQRVALDGSVVLAPKQKSSKLPAIYVSDGEVLLTDLRTELIAQGMKAEYSAHSGYSQLIVNGRIIVKKLSATGKINVEGLLCEDFFTVRSTICNQYVVL